MFFRDGNTERRFGSDRGCLISYFGNDANDSYQKERMGKVMSVRCPMWMKYACMKAATYEELRKLNTVFSSMVFSTNYKFSFQQLQQQHQVSWLIKISHWRNILDYSFLYHFCLHAGRLLRSFSFKTPKFIIPRNFCSRHQIFAKNTEFSLKCQILFKIPNFR